MFVRLENPTTLNLIINIKFGLSVPSKSVCPGHSAPFDFIKDAFFEKVGSCIVIANRSGGKTIDFGILEYLESVYKPGCDSAHMGAITAQSERAYQYVSQWTHKHKLLFPYSRLTATKVVYDNSSRIEILAGTMAAANGPHPHKASIDEFELLDWDVFQQAISMPRSDKNIGAALRVATTRKRPHGNAQRMIEESETRGFKLYKWCIFEVMSNCGCRKPADCERRCGKYQTYDRENKVIRWPDICQGRGMLADGYFPFEDVLKKFIELDWETFDAEWLCNRPERSDVVFPEFGDHNKVSAFPSLPDALWGRGWDFGLDDPTAVGFFIVSPSLEVVYQVDEIVLAGQLIDDVAEKVLAKSRSLAGCGAGWTDWGDPSGKAITGVSGRSYISKLRQKDILVKTKVQQVSEGIETMKSCFKKHKITGKPKFYILEKNCPRTVAALELASWDRVKGESPHSREKYKHDIHSHPLDQLRYFLFGVFPSRRARVSVC